MRGDAASMRYTRVTRAADALAARARHPDALVLAGGTDLMVSWNAGHLNDRRILDIAGVRAWRGIRERTDRLVVGTLATFTELQESRSVTRRFPLLAAASATVGGIQIQNRGTLGGNIANASPAGDSFPPLAVYHARVKVAAQQGRRMIPLLELFAGPKRTTLAPEEIITAVELPFLRARPSRAAFRKVGTRAAQAISKTVFAGLLWLRRDGSVREARLALGSMAPTVRRLDSVEACVTGRRLTPAIIREATACVSDDVAPIDDLRSTRDYRLTVSRNLVRAFLAP